MTSEKLTVPNVSCAHCKQTIESALEPLDGVVRAAVDIDAKTVAVEYDEAIIGRTEVVRAVEDAGYAVTA